MTRKTIAAILAGLGVVQLVAGAAIIYLPAGIILAGVCCGYLGLFALDVDAGA